jgi:hypothetical protein
MLSFFGMRWEEGEETDGVKRARTFQQSKDGIFLPDNVSGERGRMAGSRGILVLCTGSKAQGNPTLSVG